MIDTVNDAVLRDIGDKIVYTGGVAVRPFWWGNESLEALGLKTYILGPGGTAKDDSRDSKDTATGEIKADAVGGLLDLTTGSPLSTFLIVTVALLSLFLMAGAVLLIKLSTKKKMISMPNDNRSISPPQPPLQSSGFPTFCVNCGKPLAPGSNFCPGCGKEIITH